jgi:hypothetical protein
MRRVEAVEAVEAVVDGANERSKGLLRGLPRQRFSVRPLALRSLPGYRAPLTRMGRRRIVMARCKRHRMFA